MFYRLHFQNLVQKFGLTRWFKYLSCAYLPLSVKLVITQVDDHVKKRLTSQLINEISKLRLRRLSENCLNILMVQLF